MTTTTTLTADERETLAQFQSFARNRRVVEFETACGSCADRGFDEITEAFAAVDATDHETRVDFAVCDHGHEVDCREALEWVLEIDRDELERHAWDHAAGE